MQKVRLHNKILLLALSALAFTGCKKDFSNPNETPRDVVFNNPTTAAAAAVGVQRNYSVGQASSLFATVDANGLLSYELILMNAGNIGEFQFSKGGSAVDGTNNVVNNIWSNSSKVIFDANNVLAYANASPDKAYASGLISYVSIFKALALGNMAMFWEKIPDTIGVANAGFISRMDGYKKAVAVLDYAINFYNSNPPNSTVLSRLPTDINLINTLYALKARYALFSGDYAAALAAANQVDLTKRSVMNFNSQALNPVFESATNTNNMFQVVDSTFGLPVEIAPDVNDARIKFHARIKNPNEANPRWRINGFYANGSTGVPIFLPGEIILIKAEALARQASPDLDAALTELNKVVTKQPSQDIYGIGANLPTISGPLTKDELLTQIYRNRSIELYMTGMRLEDQRRFNRPVIERKRSNLPYPFRERDNNSNIPADPAF
jgi:tetratricopeptide (TPR) repeat protein